MPTPPRATPTRTPWLLLLLPLAYLALNGLTQIWVSPTMDQDLAEQFVLSQALSWGYSDQPPLPSWGLYALFSITGPSLAAAAALKVLVLAMLVWVMLAIGRELRLTTPQQALLLCGMALVPQISWESQRDLTHSVAVTLMAAATLWQVLALQRNAAWWRYALLGVLAVLGMLSKYNYLLFLVVLVVAMLSLPHWRSLLLRREVLLTAVLAALLMLPHLLWVRNNLATATSAMHKFDAGSGTRLHGLGAMLSAALAYLGPLLVFSPLLWWGRVRSQWPDVQQHAARQLLTVLLPAVLLVVAAFVLVSNTQSIKDRWYQPLLFFVPALLACWAPAQWTPRARWFAGIGLVLLVVIALILPGRVLLAETTGKPGRKNKPWPALMQAAAAAAGKPAFVVSDTFMGAGHARIAFAPSEIITDDYVIGTPPATARQGVLVCAPEGCTQPQFVQWLRRRCISVPQPSNYRSVQAPYYHVPDKTMTLQWAYVQQSPSCTP